MLLPARAFAPYPAVQMPCAGTGPSSGLSFAAKDLFDVAGYPTGGGNPLVLAMSGIKAVNNAPLAWRGCRGSRCR
jgi:amidase